ncbi:MAG: patatin-like phospholipase family protein, partial [Pseudomonadota bacterium]
MPDKVTEIAEPFAAVAEVLWRRHATNYINQSYSDDEHVALVVEGGGMRGVAAGGMVSAIEDLGLTHMFDSVHGSSAGAAAGAFLACGQANFG